MENWNWNTSFTDQSPVFAGSGIEIDGLLLVPVSAGTYTQEMGPLPMCVCGVDEIVCLVEKHGASTPPTGRGHPSSLSSFSYQK